MKKTIFTLAFALLSVCTIKSEELSTDTTFQFNRKYVEIKEGNEKIEVKVFEKDSSNDTLAYKQLYEGIFSDEKSYEKWTVQEALGFEFPFIGRKSRRTKPMIAHWDGVGLGFANISDKSLKMTNVNGVNIDASSSHEWFLNFGGHTLPIYRNNLGITTGFGINWLNLRLDKNTYLADIDGVTGVYPAPEGIKYSLSRLMIVRINVPVLLEWQTAVNRRKVFFSAGIVGGVKTFSSFLVKYKEQGNKKTIKEKDRGLNTRPLYFDYMVQAGYGNLSIYAKYSPIGIFQTNKGPEVRAVSLGFIYKFFIFD